MTDIVQSRTNPEPYRQIVDAFRNHPDNKPLEKYPGVTRVLGGTKDMTGLNAWRDRVGHEEADRIVNESRAIGTSLDTMFNDSLTTDNFDESLYKDTPGYRLFNQLKPALAKVEPIAVQMKVWSDHMKMMGYLDCFGTYDGQLTLIDCKNSKTEKKEEYLEDYFLQCTAYSMMIYEMLNIRVRQLALFIARRDSPFPQIIVRDIKPWVPEVMKRVKTYYGMPKQ